MDPGEFNADDFINTSFENVSRSVPDLSFDPQQKPSTETYHTQQPKQMPAPLAIPQPPLKNQIAIEKKSPKSHHGRGETGKKKYRRFERNQGVGRMRPDLRMALKQKVVSNMLNHQFQQAQFMPYMVPQLVQQNQVQFMSQLVPVTTSASPQFQYQQNMISPQMGFVPYHKSSNMTAMPQYQFLQSQSTYSPTAAAQDQELLSPTTNEILNQLQQTSIKPFNERPSIIDTGSMTPRLGPLSNNSFRSPSFMTSSFPLSPSNLNFAQLTSLKSEPTSVQSSTSDIAGQLMSMARYSNANQPKMSSYGVASNSKAKLQLTTKPLPPKNQNSDEIMFANSVMTPSGDAQSFADFLRRKSSVMPDSPSKAPASKKLW